MINNSFLEEVVNRTKNTVALAETYKAEAVRNFEVTFKLCMVLCSLEIITPKELYDVQFTMNAMVTNLP